MTVRKKKPWNQKAQIRSALRKVWRWSPVRSEVLRAARLGRGSYLCASCKNLFGPKMVKVDHIEPVVVPGMDAYHWTTYIERLFCSARELQVLCKSCHDTKTALERAYLRKMKHEIHKP